MNSALPKIPDYLKILETDSFKEMEIFSDKFLDLNKKNLTEYALKWVADPLHQWSRQWEYPYVYDKIAAYSAKSENSSLRIMDGGSGVTFFPYFLTSKLPGSDLCCADMNSGYVDIFTNVNNTMDRAVKFTCCSLEKLESDNNFFDIIYCISVLEHTKNYQKIISEFSRVLKPGGKLILTFDLSLDGRNDISPKGARALLDAVEEKFIPDEILDKIDGSLLSKNNLLNTKFAYAKDPELIWTTPPPAYKQFLENIKYLLRGKKWGKFPPLLTVFCASFTKKHDNLSKNPERIEDGVEVKQLLDSGCTN
jgi:SAM-dependent methyltransferase